MKFLPPPFPLSPYPSATRPNGCRENINTHPPPTPSSQPLCVLKSNELLFSGPWKSCGPRGLKRKGGGGWEEQICTKLLLRPETARPCPPADSNRRLAGPGMVQMARLNARQTSKAAFGDKVAKWNTGFERVIFALGSNTRDLLLAWLPDSGTGAGRGASPSEAPWPALLTTRSGASAGLA